MARVHHVKKARKANRAAGIKKGDSYYWWAFRFGGKHYSKTMPRRSQTTQSAFYGTLWDAEDDLNEVITNKDSTPAQIKEALDNAVSSLRELADECQQSLDNMPEGLQQGSTGEMLTERVDACNEIADEIEQIEYDEKEPRDIGDVTEEVEMIDFSRV